jgi:uncharacterized protein GlcG (DUF336 family)
VKKTFLALALAFPIAHATAAAPALTSAQAISLATHAVAVAEKQGYKVSATVVDAEGGLLASVRGDGASPTTAKTTLKKAITAIAAQQHTSDLLANVHKEGHAYLDKFVLSTLRDRQDHIVLLGGGVLIKDKDTIIGAIGVGGAPGGHLDDAIAYEAMKATGI